jgi:hypothetical protein
MSANGLLEPGLLNIQGPAEVAVRRGMVAAAAELQQVAQVPGLTWAGVVADLGRPPWSP